MARNNIVRGLIKTKDWFFQVTGSPAKRGSRFLTGDRPTEIIFRAFLESFTNKAEITDRAYEDIETKTLSEKQGLVTLATDAQAKSRIDKSDSIARVVQPSQLPEITAGAGITVTIDPTETKRTKYIIEGGSVCPCVTGIGQKIDTEIPNDADIVVFYDGTSFVDSSSINSFTLAKNKTTTWFNAYRASHPDFKGNLIEIQLSGSGAGLVNFNIRDSSSLGSTGIAERFLKFPKEYLDNNIENAFRITTYDGIVTTDVTLTPPTTNKCLFLLFEDEAAGNSTAPGYHTVADWVIGMKYPNEGPTTVYIQDYQEFVEDTYARFEFFKMIIYPAYARSIYDCANFHAFLTKALAKNTLEVSPGLTVTQASAKDRSGNLIWESTDMDFMTTANPFFPYCDLGYYNFVSTQYDFTSQGRISEITDTQFITQVTDALEETDGDSKKVTITPWIEYNNDPDTKVYGTPYQLKVLK